VGQLLAKAGVSHDRVIGVGIAFPDDIARAHLPDQPGDYEAWARSGEIGWLRAPNHDGAETQLQNIVSLSALYARLASRGVRIDSPRGLTKLEPEARTVVQEWIEEATSALANSLIAINCLIDPEAILIGGRLPATLIDQLASSLNERMRKVADQVPAIATVARAATSDDAPAVGAAILPFSNRFLPTRVALLKAP
jgi:predicted NBD/HSP70 family sugar kinase